MVIGGFNVAGLLAGESHGGGAAARAGAWSSQGPAGSSVPKVAASPHIPEERLVGLPRVEAQPQNREETAQLKSFSSDDGDQGPGWLAYDSADTSFYVTVSPSSVDVIPFNASGYLATTDVIPVGSAPFGAAVDNATGDIFITNSGSNNVSVISGSSQKVIANIGVGAIPLGIAYDWSTGDIYVANNGSNNVSVISGATFSVVATVSVGSSPLGVAYDGATRQVFVADYGSAQVSVISGPSNQLLTSINVGLEPFGVAVDAVADTIWVTNSGSSNVSVISAVSDTLVATIPVVLAYYGGPAPMLEGLAFDPTDGLVWVGAGSGYAVVINPANESVTAFFPVDPYGVVYDPDSGYICVTNTLNVSFECFVSTPMYGGSSTQSVTFSESGLPLGTPWSVTLGWPTQNSTSSAILFGGAFAYGLPYTVWPTHGYTATSATGEVPNGPPPVTIDVTFVASPGPYSVKFQEVGLPEGTTWSVVLSGSGHSTTDTILSFSEPSGMYPYRIADVPGWHQYAVAYSGVIEVSGASVVVPVLTFQPYTFVVNFSESGLARWTPWSVTLGGSTETSSSTLIPFYQANGTYDFTVGAVAGYLTSSAGAVTVDGAEVSVPVAFVHAYAVTFGETGLPSGASWSATLGGTTSTSESSDIQFIEPNGTYGFVVGEVSGYSTVPGLGTIVVVGLPVGQGITFVPLAGEYPVTFEESGLPSGTSWSVTIGGLNLSTNGTSIVTIEENGTFGYVIGSVTGYAPRSSSGLVTVQGAPVSVSVTFTYQLPWVYTVSFAQSGLPNGETWLVVLNGSVVEGTKTSATFIVPNGSYHYLVRGPASYLVLGIPPAGNLTVHGTSVLETTHFIRGPTRTITFRETGMSHGMTWCASVGYQVCSTGGTIEFKNLTPWSYPYAVSSIAGYTESLTVRGLLSPSSGWISLTTRGATIATKFTQVTYVLTFEETGLSEGKNWVVKVAGLFNGQAKTETRSSKAGTITFAVPNGTFSYTIESVKGYTGSGSGTVTVSGAPVAVNVTFTDPPAGVLMRGSLPLAPFVTRED